MSSATRRAVYSKESLKILPNTERIAYLSFSLSFVLSLEQDELTCGTFDMRDVNVARKTIYGYSKIVQIPLSVWHASESWRITLHIVGDVTTDVAAAISSSGIHVDPRYFHTLQRQSTRWLDYVCSSRSKRSNLFQFATFK